jgi:hypothetical protein
MSDQIKPLIAKLREELERKYKAQLDAIASLEAHLLGGNETMTIPPPPPPVVTANRKDRGSGHGSQVQHVLNAVGDDFKSVAQIAEETGMTLHRVRAVLYSEHVKPKLVRKKDGGLAIFKKRPDAATDTKAGSSAPGETAAAQVQSVLARASKPITFADICQTIGPSLNRKAAAAAIYYLKKTGKATHNENTGAYQLVRNSNGQG